MVYNIAIFSPFGLDFNTSGNICPMIFLFAYASIRYTLIIKHLPEALRFFLCFRLTVVNVVHFIRSLHCGRYVFWVTGSNLLLRMVSTSVFLFLIFVKLENINMGETTLHILYPYITPQTPIFLWFVKYRPTYPDPFLFYDFSYDKLTHMKGWMVGLSYHWMLYLIFSGRGVLTYLQYDYPHPPFF